MARFRNDFNEGRVVPSLGYVLVAAEQVVTVPDDEWHHWDAGGWTPLDHDPRPKPEPEPAAAAPSPAAPAALPAAAAAIPAKALPAAAVESEDQL